MKKLQKIPLLLFFLLNVYLLSAQTPFTFTKGVNLNEWFQAGTTQTIPFTKYGKNDIENIKSLGCDVIRLPISLHYFTSGAPDYKVDTLFYQYLDQVIDWTEELNINLIIDNHTVEDATSKTVETPLLKIWPQMARHYKGRSTSVFYEILNEPHTLLPADWAAIQAKVVDSIRAYDTKHTIIVTGADWGGIAGLTALKKLADPNLIYSFHFYDPFLFTHQGATWTDPSIGDLKNVPFPYDATRMPDCPTSLKGSWVESSLSTDYKTEGTMAKLKSTIDEAVNYAKTNNVKIYCGEFGVYNVNSLDADRVNWYKQVPAYLSSQLIPWTMWSYQGGMGLFNKGSNETFEYDINRPVAEGLGFTIPPFKEYVLKADSVPFNIYKDFPGQGMTVSVPGSGTTDLFSAVRHQGNYGIYCTDVAQYTNIEFKFKLAKDMSKLVAADYTLDLWVKADSPGSSVILRFIDTKTSDPKDHPWRKDYTLNSSVVPFDGQWHLVQIPLKKFVDAGSWDGTWYGSTNSFDWKAVDRFQIVADNTALTGKKFWFDDIHINGTPAVPTIVSLTTSDATPLITGTATVAAGETLTVTVNGVTYRVGDSNLSIIGNSWSLQIPADKALAENTYAVTATVTDALGNNATDVTTNELTIDTTLPVIPTVALLTTSDTTPVISGTATVAAGETLTVTVNGVTYRVGDNNLSITGKTWTLQIPVRDVLTQATYPVMATVTDKADNSATDATTNELVIDTTLPVIPTVAPLTTSDTTPVISGTATVAAGETLTVTVNGVTYRVGDSNLSIIGNTWTLQIPVRDLLAQATYPIMATVTDKAGNAATDVTSNELTIDTTLPVIPTVALLATSDTTPVLSGTATLAIGETLTVTVNGVTYREGDSNLSIIGNSWTLQIPVRDLLAQATYPVMATVTDKAGNSATDVTTNELTIDTTLPVIPTVALLTTSDTTPVISGTATVAAGETLTVTVNGVTYKVGDSNLSIIGNTWSLQIPDGNKLADNTYAVTATLTDAANNTSTDVTDNELVIDTTAPHTSNVEQLINNEFKATVFPNPVKGNTMIQYDLKTSGLVNVSLYSLAGKKIALLVEAHQPKGRHQLSLSAEQMKLTDGVYVCKITSLGKISAIKIVVNK